MKIGMGTEAPSAPTEPVGVYTVIMATVEQMAAVAWQKLGLQPDFLTGKIHKDLSEAKVAIDITTHLASFLEPKLDEEDKRRLHNLIRDLRTNFVQQSKETAAA